MIGTRKYGIYWAIWKKKIRNTEILEILFTGKPTNIKLDFREQWTG